MSRNLILETGCSKDLGSSPGGDAMFFTLIVLESALVRNNESVGYARCDVCPV